MTLLKILLFATLLDEAFLESKPADEQLRLPRAAPFHHGQNHRPVTTTSFSRAPTEFSLPIEPDHFDEDEIVGLGVLGRLVSHRARSKARRRRIRTRGRLHRPLLRSPHVEFDDEEEDSLVGSPHMGDDVVGMPNSLEREGEWMANANFNGGKGKGRFEREDEDDVVGMPEVNFDQRMASVPFWERVAIPEQHFDDEWQREDLLPEIETFNHPVHQEGNILRLTNVLSPQRQAVLGDQFEDEQLTPVEMEDLWFDHAVDPNFAQASFLEQQAILDQHFPEDNQVGFLQMAQDAQTFRSSGHPIEQPARLRASLERSDENQAPIPDEYFNPWSNLPVEEDEPPQLLGLPYPDQQMQNFENSFPSHLHEPLIARSKPVSVIPTVYYKEPEIVMYNIDNSEEVRQGLKPGFSIIPTNWKPPPDSNLYVQGDYQSESGQEPVLAVLPGKWTHDYGYDEGYHDYQVIPVSYNLEDGYRRSAEDEEDDRTGEEDGRRHFKKGSLFISKQIIKTKPSKFSSLEIQHSGFTPGHQKDFHGHQNSGLNTQHDSLHSHQQSQGFHQNSGPVFHQQQSQFHQGFHPDSSGFHQGTSGFHQDAFGSHQGSGFQQDISGFHHGQSNQGFSHQDGPQFHQPNHLVTINNQKTTVVVPHGSAQIAQVAGNSNSLSQSQAGHPQHFQSSQVIGNLNSVSQSQARGSDSVGAPFLINVPKRSSVWRSYSHQDKKRSVEGERKLRKRSVVDEPTRINLFGDDPKVLNVLEGKEEEGSKKDDHSRKRAADGVGPMRMSLFDNYPAVDVQTCKSRKRSVDDQPPKISLYGNNPSFVSISNFLAKQNEPEETKHAEATVSKQKRSIDDNVTDGSTKINSFEDVNIPALLTKQNEMLEAIKNIAQDDQDLIFLTEVGAGMVDHFADFFKPHAATLLADSNNFDSSTPHKMVKRTVSVSPRVLAKRTTLDSDRKIDNFEDQQLCEMMEKIMFFRPLVASKRTIPIQRSTESTTRLGLSITNNLEHHKVARRSLFEPHEVEKRTVPLIRLLTDPNAELDMSKTLRNVGTAARSSLESERQPIHHVRNLAGSAKDTFMAALKVVPQNFLIPSNYKIVSKNDETDPSPQQSNIVNKKGSRTMYEPSKRVYQPSASRTNQSPVKRKWMKKKAKPEQQEGVMKSEDPEFSDLRSKQPEFFDFGSEEPRSGHTLQRMGSMMRESFRSGHDVFNNIGNMYKSARKAVVNIPHIAPRVGLQSLRIPALKHPLLERKALKHRTSSSNGVVVVTPKVLHVEDADKVSSPFPDDDFVGIGDVMNSLGLADPEVEDLGHSRIVISNLVPKRRAKFRDSEGSRGRRRFDITCSEEPKHEKRKRYLLGSDEAPEEVKETLETIEALNNVKDSVGADTFSDFLSMMKSGFLDLIRDTMKIAEDSLGACLDYDKVKGKVLLGHQDEPSTLLGFNYEKKKNVHHSNIENEGERPGKDRADKKHHHHKHHDSKNEEQVGAGLRLPQQLLHPFMDRPSQSERRQFLQGFGDSVELDEDQNDFGQEDTTVQNEDQPHLFNIPLAQDGQNGDLMNLAAIQARNRVQSGGLPGFPNLHLGQEGNKVQNEGLAHLLHLPGRHKGGTIQNEGLPRLSHLPKTQQGGMIQNKALPRLLNLPRAQEVANIQNEDQQRPVDLPWGPEAVHIQSDDLSHLLSLPLVQEAMNIVNEDQPRFRNPPLVGESRNTEEGGSATMINPEIPKNNMVQSEDLLVEEEGRKVVGAINPILFNDSYQLDFSKFPFLDVAHHGGHNKSGNSTEGVEAINNLKKDDDVTENSAKVGEALMITSLFENNDFTTDVGLTSVPDIGKLESNTDYNPNFGTDTVPLFPKKVETSIQLNENSSGPANKQTDTFAAPIEPPQSIVPNQQEHPVGISMKIGKKLLTPYMGKATKDQIVSNLEYYGNSYLEDSGEELYLRNRKIENEHNPQYVGAQIEEIPEPKRVNTVQQSFLRHPLEDNRL